MLDFDTLLDAHLAMLTGSLLDGVEAGPEGARYAFSGKIPDPTLNFATGIRTRAQFDWAVDIAEARGREPAFLARDGAQAAALGAFRTPAATFPAAWMVAAAAEAPHRANRVTRHGGAVPLEAFEAVFAELSDAPFVRAHLARHYLPALRAAQAPPGIDPVHLVLEDETGPAACASLYRRGALAGLYNVSTRADRQRRGLGACVTRLALAEAGARGASHVALQCPAEGHLPVLYARAGFRTVAAPVLVCLTVPG